MNMIPTQSGLARLDFGQSLANYWMQYFPVGAKISTAIKLAVAEFARETGKQPQFALVRSIPAGAEEFQDVYGATLVRSEWVPEQCVAVGLGGTEEIHADYRHWKKVTLQEREGEPSRGVRVKNETSHP